MVTVGISKRNSVRLAEYRDLRKIADLAIAFLRDSEYSFEINPDKFLKTIEDFIKAEGNEKICLVLVDVEDKPVGMLAAMVGSPMFSDTRIAQEIVWYIREDFRGPRESLTLIDIYERWAKSINCNFVQLSNLEILQGPKVEKLYLRKGYEKRESAFLKEIKQDGNT